jgi:hypothetical protein
MYRPEIQQFCDVNKVQNWKLHPTTIELNDDFCLFKDPSKVIKDLLDLLYHAKTDSNYVSLNHSGKFSFGALFLMDNLLWMIASKKRWAVHTNLAEKELTILANLKSIVSNKSESKYAYIINNQIRINRSDDKLARQLHKEKSKEMRDLIERGMNENADADFILPSEANAAIESAISEHFDNILLHAPKTDHGFMWGFFDKSTREVTIIIYNFGNTIASTLNKAKLPPHVQTAVNEVVRNHTQKTRLFGWGKTFSKENALTLLAVQEGISSRLDADLTRGHGLIDFIDHCFEISSNSKVSIISGKTAIKIDSKYQIGRRNVFGRDRKIIALNKENDIFEKPDSEYVRNMPFHFNGVIIETRIPLQISA